MKLTTDVFKKGQYFVSSLLKGPDIFSSVSHQVNFLRNLICMTPLILY